MTVFYRNDCIEIACSASIILRFPGMEPVLPCFSLPPTAIDYREPKVSATMQQHSSVVASYPGSLEEGEKRAWCLLFVHFPLPQRAWV